MIPDWLWVVMVGGVVSAAGFWAKRIQSALDGIQKTLSDSLKMLASIEATQKAHQGRIDRIEGLIDNATERKQ